jgi:hypothetical protein
MKKLALLAFLLCSIATYSYSQSAADTLAVKQVVERESATWRSGDAKGHAGCWKIQPYSRVLVSTAEGKMYDVPTATIANSVATTASRGGASSNSNYKISIIGNSAWASFDEESISKDGKKSYSAEFKILEKIDGQWKIVAMSVHAYNK